MTARHQAQSLVDHPIEPAAKPAPWIAVAGGKGGVGKTLLSVNLAVLAARTGYRTHPSRQRRSTPEVMASRDGGDRDRSPARVVSSTAFPRKHAMATQGLTAVFGRVIEVYTRAQAVDDGVLVDVSAPYPSGSARVDRAVFR